MSVAPPPRRPLVVVAPDKFKGSVTAAEAAAALAEGLRGTRPDVDVVECPIADGGDGTVAAALSRGFSAVRCTVSGPLGRPVEAVFAVRGSTAVLEAAAAAGLGALGQAPSPETAAASTTRGVGELILAALGCGVGRIVIGLGGTVTTDGGVGALAALGARTFDAEGRPIDDRGSALGRVASLDTATLDPRLAGVELVLACDVDNPLTGPAGAAVVYAPQKGASADQVGPLDAALAAFADVVALATGRDLRDQPGAGAAGGLAFGLSTVRGACVRSGIDVVLDLLGVDTVLSVADLVVVGEGSLDAQSLRGKGPVGVARAAAAHGVPTVAVVGRSLLAGAELASAGFRAVHSLTDLEADERVAMRRTMELLRVVAARVADDHLPPPAPEPAVMAPPFGT